VDLAVQFRENVGFGAEDSPSIDLPQYVYPLPSSSPSEGKTLDRTLSLGFSIIIFSGLY
jgi:hypothetical protein